MKLFMKKLSRFYFIGFALVMLFSLIGCESTIEDDISGYKATAKYSLQEYADNKGMDNYCSENWLIILDYVTQGKEEIELKNNIVDIDSIVIQKKLDIDMVQQEEETGVFKSLFFAYYSGWLTRQDLMNIAYQCGERNSLDDDFEPSTILPLSAKKEEQIKLDWENQNVKPERLLDPDYKGVIIDRYYGTYGDCVAVKMGYVDGTYIMTSHEYYIDGIKFYNNNGFQTIEVWKKNS